MTASLANDDTKDSAEPGDAPQAALALIERRRGMIRRARQAIKRLRLLFALAAFLLAAYMAVSYRVYTVPGLYNPGSNSVQFPIRGIERADTLILQNLNLWRDPKLHDVVIYEAGQSDEGGEGAPVQLLGRIRGLPGEKLVRAGPTMAVGGREPLPVGFDLGAEVKIRDGDVIPEACYLILADTDAVAYADSRTHGYIPRDRILKRVSINLAHAFGRRRPPGNRLR